MRLKIFNFLLAVELFFIFSLGVYFTSTKSPLEKKAELVNSKMKAPQGPIDLTQEDFTYHQKGFLISTGLMKDINLNK